MMYLVAYELRPSRDATDLINELKAFPGWSHYIDNVWMIISGEQVPQVRDRLRKHLNLDPEGNPTLKKSDLLIIVQVTPDAGTPDGLLPAAGWDWINRSRAL